MNFSLNFLNKTIPKNIKAYIYGSLIVFGLVFKFIKRKYLSQLKLSRFICMLSTNKKGENLNNYIVSNSKTNKVFKLLSNKDSLIKNNFYPILFTSYFDYISYYNTLLIPHSIYNFKSIEKDKLIFNINSYNIESFSNFRYLSTEKINSIFNLFLRLLKDSNNDINSRDLNKTNDYFLNKGDYVTIFNTSPNMYYSIFNNEIEKKNEKGYISNLYTKFNKCNFHIIQGNSLILNQHLKSYVRYYKNLEVISLCLPIFAILNDLLRYVFSYFFKKYQININRKINSEIDIIKNEHIKLINNSSDLSAIRYNQRLLNTLDNKIKTLKCLKCKKNYSCVLNLLCGHFIVCHSCFKDVNYKCVLCNSEKYEYLSFN